MSNCLSKEFKKSVSCFSQVKFYLKKSHTCEEGGAPSEFLLAFIDELEKQIIIKKRWSGPIKNTIILIFPLLHLKKKLRKKQL